MSECAWYRLVDDSETAKKNFSILHNRCMTTRCSSSLILSLPPDRDCPVRRFKNGRFWVTQSCCQRTSSSQVCIQERLRISPYDERIQNWKRWYARHQCSLTRQTSLQGKMSCDWKQSAKAVEEIHLIRVIHILENRISNNAVLYAEKMTRLPQMTKKIADRTLERSSVLWQIEQPLTYGI